jgi:hypothetical protein
VARQYGLNHLAIGTVLIFGIVFAVDAFRMRDRTGPFHPRADCLQTVRGLGTAARDAGTQPVQDRLVLRAVTDARRAGLTGAQPTSVALYMNFAVHAADFDTTAMARDLIDAACGPAPH